VHLWPWFLLKLIRWVEPSAALDGSGMPCEVRPLVPASARARSITYIRVTSTIRLIFVDASPDPVPLPQCAVAVDLVVLTVREGALCVLTVRRAKPPFAGKFALPGTLIRPAEDLPTAVRRALTDNPGLKRFDLAFEQLRTFAAPRRDPRGRVVSVAHLAVGHELPSPRRGPDSLSVQFEPVSEYLSRRAGPLAMAFDHKEILAVGVERLRARLEYTGLGAALCPAEFTVGELRRVYRAVWDVEIDPANFHRKVTHAEDFLVPTGGSTSRGGGRPAVLYRADPRALLHPPILRP